MATITLPPLAADTSRDAAQLVAEIEAYLATLPAPRRALPAMPHISALGQVQQPWNAGLPVPTRTLADRLHRRGPAPVPLDVAGHLRLLSRYLTVHGWCQKALVDAAGRRCMLGAQYAVLSAGYGSAEVVVGARQVMLREIATMGGGAFARVEDWNDAEGRSAAQVHRLLDVAAARVHSWS